MVAGTGRRVLASLAAAAALLAPAPASAKFDPAHRWSTAETEHFVLHFHEGAAEVAARAARVAEEVHARLAPRVGPVPRAKTRLILADDVPAEGWASPYPYNQIFLSLAPPVGEPGFGSTVHDDWLRLVITHEYAHVLQLDMASGFPGVLRSVFGRLYFPNALQPRWLVEGLATLEETELTSGGRGRSPGAEMVLRMAALRDRLPRLDEMAVAPDPWPAGQVPYLFGESFLRHILSRYGREKVAALSTAYAGRTLPFFVESTGRGVLGAEYRNLWEEWAAELRALFRAQERAVAERGITPSTPLTSGGFSTVAPAWSPDGGRIAWLQADGHDAAGVWVMNADGSGKRRLARSPFPSAGLAARISWSPDGGRVYYAKPGFVRGVAVVDDLWAYDFAAGKEVRVTREAGARDPHPSPDGSRLLFVAASRGMTRLEVLDLAGPLPAAGRRSTSALTAWSAEQFTGPRWSQDGSRIAVGVWEPGGNKSLRVLDADGTQVAEFGRDRALDGAPEWSPDGRLVLFASDRTGIFNLFAWEPATGGLRQVTNVLGGAFSPSPSPDGRSLAFASYTERGLDVHVMELNPALWRPPEPWRDPYPPAEPSVPREPLEARPYSPSDTLLPRLWAPWFSSGFDGAYAGFITGGQDVLQRHRYLMIGLYSPSSGRISYTADYVYDGLRPSIRLAAFDGENTYAELLAAPGGALDYTERERSVGADVVLAFPGPDSSHALSLGYRYRYLEALSPPQPPVGGATAPFEGSLGSARFSWGFTNAVRPLYSISPERGRRLVAGVERFAEAAGSELEFTRFCADWTEYLPVPARHHVLQGRLFLGRSTGEEPAQGAFRLGGDPAGDVAYAVESRDIHLRGYPPNAFRGDSAVLAGVEYRFPMAQFGRGGVSAPVFLRRLHGAVFLEAGDAWDADVRSASLKRAIGAELRLDVYFSYQLPITIRFGISWGLDEGGGVYPTLGLWLPQEFLSAASPRERR